MDAKELTRIANKPGFGTGQVARDQLAAEAKIRDALPSPDRVAKVQARSGGGGHLVPVCEFGNSHEDGKDWGLYHYGSDDLSGILGHDAKEDAEFLADLVNAYRLGLLVQSDALTAAQERIAELEGALQEVCDAKPEIFHAPATGRPDDAAPDYIDASWLEALQEDARAALRKDAP